MKGRKGSLFQDLKRHLISEPITFLDSPSNFHHQGRHFDCKFLHHTLFLSSFIRHHHVLYTLFPSPFSVLNQTEFVRNCTYSSFNAFPHQINSDPRDQTLITFQDFLSSFSNSKSSQTPPSLHLFPVHFLSVSYFTSTISSININCCLFCLLSKCHLSHSLPSSCQKRHFFSFLIVDNSKSPE